MTCSFLEAFKKSSRVAHDMDNILWSLLGLNLERNQENDGTYFVLDVKIPFTLYLLVIKYGNGESIPSKT